MDLLMYINDIYYQGGPGGVGGSYGAGGNKVIFK